LPFRYTHLPVTTAQGEQETCILYGQNTKFQYVKAGGAYRTSGTLVKLSSSTVVILLINFSLNLHITELFQLCREIQLSLLSSMSIYSIPCEYVYVQLHTHMYMHAGEVRAKQMLRGRAVAQAVSRWLPTVAARVASGQHVGFVMDKEALGQVFSEYFGFPCQLFHQFLHHPNHPGLAR
jgi:hypothetical protein